MDMPGDRFLPCPGCGSLLTGETDQRLLWECRYCRAVFLVAEKEEEYRVPE
jgi:ribosomal protein L37AE/L43A